MSPTASISSLKCNALIPLSPLFLSPTCKSYKIYHPRNLRINNCAHSQLHPIFSYQNSSISRNLYSLRPRETSVIAFDGKNPSGEGDDGALDTVLSLYSAFKNNDLLGKMQVLTIFYYLMKMLGQNFHIVVQPTIHEGTQVGVHWRIEGKKFDFPLGKGFSFHLHQSFHGKAFVRNFEMLVQPLLHFEPLRSKMMAALTGFKEKMGSLMNLDSENQAMKIFSIVLALLPIALLLFLLLKSKI